jgi:hypothetical protein
MLLHENCYKKVEYLRSGSSSARSLRQPKFARSGVTMPIPTQSAPGRRALLWILIFGTTVVLCGSSPRPAQPQSRATRTQCDPLIPLKVELVSLGEPSPGGLLQFQVDVQSGLDSDQIKSSHVEYEMPPALRHSLASERDLPLLQGKARARIGVIIPDRQAYEIRARVVLELRNGATISQTAVRWVNAGPDYRPDSMSGRIILPDGTGIRVYRGVTTR